MQNSTQSTHLAFIDPLRIFACLCIILTHTLSMALMYQGDVFSKVSITLISAFRSYALIAVPIFVMISGALFLRPEKQIDIKKLYGKNIVRLLLGIVIFGTLFALMEIVFTERKIEAVSFVKAFLNMLENKSWGHLWYLYMCVGLYLFVPLFKKFVDNANDIEFRITLLVLFVFLAIFPVLNSIFKIHLGFEIPLTSVYVYYFFMGYAIQQKKIVIPIWGTVIISILFIAYPILQCIFIDVYTSDFLIHGGAVTSPILNMLFAPVLFSFFMNKNINTEKVIVGGGVLMYSAKLLRSIYRSCGIFECSLQNASNTFHKCKLHILIYADIYCDNSAVVWQCLVGTENSVC